MPGKEKEIFRDCYDILKANLAKPKMENKDWEVLKLQSSRLTTEKILSLTTRCFVWPLWVWL